jgi:hypothetical protein
MLRTAEFEQSAYREPRSETGDHLDQPTLHSLYEVTPEDFRAQHAAVVANLNRIAADGTAESRRHLGPATDPEKRR